MSERAPKVATYGLIAALAAAAVGCTTSANHESNASPTKAPVDMSKYLKDRPTSSNCSGSISFIEKNPDASRFSVRPFKIKGVKGGCVPIYTDRTRNSFLGEIATINPDDSSTHVAVEDVCTFSDNGTTNRDGSIIPPTRVRFSITQDGYDISGSAALSGDAILEKGVLDCEQNGIPDTGAIVPNSTLGNN